MRRYSRLGINKGRGKVLNFPMPVLWKKNIFIILPVNANPPPIGDVIHLYLVVYYWSREQALASN
jgi:hypothetical protein